MIQTIGFIGLGRLASAIIEGLLDSGFPKDCFIFADKDARNSENKVKKFGIRFAQSIEDLIESSSVLVLAVKPNQMLAVLDEIAIYLKSNLVNDKIIISVAAGITINKISSCLNQDLPIFRVMPNTSVKFHCSATAIAYGEFVLGHHRAIVFDIFSKLGICLDIPEKAFDMVTAISGSGPAFLYALSDMIAHHAEKECIDYSEALLLFAQTMIGAGTMLLKSGKNPEDLIKEVKSLKGTTEAGLDVLYASDFQEIWQAILTASLLRSKELSRGSF